MIRWFLVERLFKTFVLKMILYFPNFMDKLPLKNQRQEQSVENLLLLIII